jgi:hypothetical protein
MPLVYKELPRMARFYMAREFTPPGHTLQTTVLVNEVCVSGGFRARQFSVEFIF